MDMPGIGIGIGAAIGVALGIGYIVGYCVGIKRGAKIAGDEGRKALREYHEHAVNMIRGLR